MRIQPSTLSSGPVSATITALTPTGREVAAAIHVEVPDTVPEARRYAVALRLVTSFIAHTDVLTTVHHVQQTLYTGYTSYDFD